jgi:hypothetical protein
MQIFIAGSIQATKGKISFSEQVSFLSVICIGCHEHHSPLSAAFAALNIAVVISAVNLIADNQRLARVFFNAEKDTLTRLVFFMLPKITFKPAASIVTMPPAFNYSWHHSPLSAARAALTLVF